MRISPRPILIAITVIILGMSMLGSGATANEPVSPDVRIDADLPVLYSTSGMITDEVIIEFESLAESRSAQAANLLPGVAFDRAMTYRPVARYKILDNSTVFEVITRLRGFPGVAEVYPNYKRSLNRVPNDQYYQLQQEELAVVRAQQAWDIQTGSADILVGVIDTGVDYTLADLIPNLVLPGVNVREDWVPDEVMDDSGHGTAVSGVIGAVGNNEIGVVGINWTIKMLPIRACGMMLDCDLFDEVEGIDVARERGCDVINLSIGGVGTISVEEKAVTAAYEAGCVIVAAAGNRSEDIGGGLLYEATGDPDIDRQSLYYPAGLPEVIGVGAIENNGERALFSNYGEDILSLMAPGVDIVTTVPEEECYLYTGDGPPYGFATGTSFSTPMVAGAAALVLAQFPGLPPDAVRARLETAAIPMPGPDNDLNGINDYFGYGILNIEGALSQTTTSGNEYMNVGVTANPLIPGEVLVLVQELVPLDYPPTARWTVRGSTVGGSVAMHPVETRPGFYIGRFAVSGGGSVMVSVTGMSGGTPTGAVNVVYSVGD